MSQALECQTEGLDISKAVTRICRVSSALRVTRVTVARGGLTFSIMLSVI